ncbi:polysaccharide biosynthesis/export family protein [Autumnicola edwardsiae]|uniref:Polysaccharide biosynthesis/export family protein n=1 Tax=Autumnicola edwardsiae TaxID=3075594 RepID=A0ABU3CZ32_9FLAO|nr:polysaccharide biosynthesis/export family protein [Zunongwangia sp. F297]MDT0651629.1 polysaccharide biosynthesis/export family protein [Zunongwangia sp. F297]
MKSPKFLKPFLLIISLLLMTASCVSRKDVVYFQGLETAEAKIDTQQKSTLQIKPNDLLTISVSAPEQEAAMPFNLPVIGVPQGGMEVGLSVNGRQQLQTYLVDSEGNIEFPILGTVAVAGYNRQQLASELKGQISEYLQDPIVNVRLVNFQVSVLGEVNRPGTFEVRDEYLSLPKALGLAGDLSIYGRRDNVLVMREENGTKTHAYLDLTSADIINSPYYYLQQNDVVYVEPNAAQRQSASYNRNASVYISIASVLVSLIVLIAR